MPSDTHIATREPFQLGPWRVEPGLCEISSGGNAIHLEPRTMAVLCYLAARAQQTVSRDDLLDDLWKTRFVVEDALTRCISQLRQHLGDDPRNPRFIQTVPKVGYRLLVAPEPLPGEADAPASAPAPAPTRSPGRSRTADVIVAVLVLLIVALAWRILAYREPSSPRASIAILPFVVIGDSADARTFADGMTEDLIQLLATVPDIRVASRTSSYYFKDKQADLATIARELGVAHVLEGSVRRERDRIIVKAQLIDAASDAHIWAQEYDRELHDLFEVQKEITLAVAQRLELSMSTSFLQSAPATRNMGAYQLFVEGRMALNQYEQGAAQNSIAMLEAAVDLDPQFAGAWSTLALARWVSPASTPMTPGEILASDEAARTAARRALSLDASSSNAQFVLADSARVSYDFIDAEKRYREALTQAPGNTSLQIGYGNLLADTGRVRNSMTRRQLSFRLDPLSPISAFFLARGTVLSGQLAEAAQAAAALAQSWASAAPCSITPRRISISVRAQHRGGPRHLGTQRLARGADHDRGVVRTGRPEQACECGHDDPRAPAMECAALSWTPVRGAVAGRDCNCVAGGRRRRDKPARTHRCLVAARGRPIEEASAFCRARRAHEDDGVLASVRLARCLRRIRRNAALRLNSCQWRSGITPRCARSSSTSTPAP